MQEKITLLKDEEWNLIDGEFCRVIDFCPIRSSVKNGKVIAMDTTTPYASLQLECKKISGEITGFITHKVDFINLWKAFRERRVGEDEEVLIIWSTKHYKSKIFKIFSRIMPKLWVMIWQKGAFEVLNNLNSNTTFSDEIIWNKLKTGPIVEFKPDVMD